ncbi:MAG: flagellar hook-length control protein FliK [Geobacteraceae bacterium]|nr:flagellar hook-length control protein FliK [Geobacteraceae bacterium]
MAFPSDIQQQVYDLLSRTSNLAIVPAEPVEPAPVGVGQQVLTLAPGQRVTAEVTGQPQAGKIPVQIAGQQLQLDLQMAVRQGQNLELTFVGNDPRPTFAMARPGVTAPPVSLSDASRLLSLLVSNEQFTQPSQRSSLQSIGDLLRQSSGQTSVLASFLDDFLTYRTDGRAVVVAPGGLLDQPGKNVGDEAGQPPSASTGLGGRATAAFEDTASKLLLNLAQRARLTLVDVANQPLAPLPLQPGDEANALVQGRLPGGRVLVQLAGESLELQLSKPVVQGEILRLALVTQQPKLVFALLGQPVQEQPSSVSDAARWLSALVSKEEGQGEAQRAVMNRLQQVVSSLPAGSSALAAILDEAMTYGASANLSARSLQNRAVPDEGKLDDGVLKLLQSLMQGNRLALLEPQVPADTLKGFQVGQQLRGDVLQSLGGGRFMIQVGGQAMEVLLPKGMKAGDGLNLFFVGEDPPTFLLVRYGKGGDALVSQTGRWVSTLLGMQDQSAPLKEGLGILRTLLEGAPSDPAQLEQVLKQGLKESGLFYEAHLSRWFSGDYSLDELLQEPQGRLSGPLGTQEGRSALVQGHEGADPRTMAIVKEQLATLQTGQLLFQGELFPGQPMEWRIKDREGRGRGSDEQEQSSPWETSLVLTLPKLGRVEVAVSLQGTHLDLVIGADQARSASLMEQGRAELQDQLLAAGLEPDSIVVKHGS